MGSRYRMPLSSQGGRTGSGGLAKLLAYEWTGHNDLMFPRLPATRCEARDSTWQGTSGQVTSSAERLVTSSLLLSCIIQPVICTGCIISYNTEKLYQRMYSCSVGRKRSNFMGKEARKRFNCSTNLLCHVPNAHFCGTMQSAAVVSHDFCYARATTEAHRLNLRSSGSVQFAAECRRQLRPFVCEMFFVLHVTIFWALARSLCQAACDTFGWSDVEGARKVVLE